MPIKREVTFNFKTSGDDIPVSFEVEDGLSAFEAWLKLEGNANKTEDDYHKERQGKPGVDVIGLTITQTSKEDA